MYGGDGDWKDISHGRMYRPRSGLLNEEQEGNTGELRRSTTKTEGRYRLL
jgi:hypothetical protein